MKKASTLIRPGNWKSVFLVLFAWCLVGSVDAQTVLDLSNDTRANGITCGDHDANVFSVSGGETFTDGAGLYPDDLEDSDDFDGLFFWTFCPDDPLTERVRITFSEFDITDFDDRLRVYNGDCDFVDDGGIDIAFTGPSVGGMNDPFSSGGGNGSFPDFGTGWVEATCDNASGCLTIGYDPDGDGNKGNGFEFTTSTQSISPEIECPDFGTAFAACGGTAGVFIQFPDSDNLCGIHTVTAKVDGIAADLFSVAQLVPGVHTITYTLSVGDNEIQTIDCPITVSDNADLVCNDNVNISLGDDCSTELRPDDIIETQFTPAYPLTISINGGSFTAPCSSCTFVDGDFNSLRLEEGTHTYTLRDDCNNACTGSISLADLQGPNCPGNTVEYIVCGDAPDAEAPGFTDCNGIAETSFNDISYGSCGNFTEEERNIVLNDVGFGDPLWFEETEAGSGVFQLPVVLGEDNLVESVTVRSWKAVDALGNTTQGCLQIFVNVRPSQLAPPTAATITVSCGAGTDPADLIGADDINGDEIDEDQVVPSFSVALPSNFSPLTGSGSAMPDPIAGGILPDDHSACGWITSFEDQVVEACGDSKKIIRSWTWLDWCAATPVLSGPFTQTIEVVDNVEPVLVSGPGAMVRSTDHFECESDITVGSAVWSDACGDIASFRTEILSVNSDGDPGVVLWTTNNNGGDFNNIQPGNYFVRYFAIDECGNETTNFGDQVDPKTWEPIPGNIHTTTLSLVDDVKPQPQCDDNINISLGSDYGRIDAASVDEGSFDNCGIASMGISLSEDGPFTDIVQVQCEDVHADLQVFLQVTDGAGNSNVCWGNVTVEDKIAPVCEAPADVTVACDDGGHFNIPDGEVTGSVARDLNARFGAPSCVDNVSCVDLGITQTVTVEGTGCGQFTVTRHWTATDWNNSSDSVYQTITVEYRPGWEINVPGDEDVTCTIGQEGPTFSFSEDDIEVISGSCDQLGVEVESREFIANDGACRKLEVTYQIINWCIYQPGDEPVALPRSADGASFSSDDFADNSFLTYTRILTLTDNVPPNVQDIANDGLCISGADCTDTATWTAWADDCVAESDMTWTAFVHETDALGNILATVATANDFVITAPIENKKYYVAEFWAADGCGNSGGAMSDPERAWDCNTPTPYAINGVSINLTAAGTVEVWASDVDQGSSDTCGDVDLYIRTQGGAAPTTAEEVAAFGSNVTFTCDQLGTQQVELYVVDEEGNFDFVQTYVIVQDNNGACKTIVVDEEQTVAGKIVNPDGVSVETVAVSVNGTMTSAMTTDNNGSFAFVVPTGGDYTITPEKDVDHLNGVSTFDLVLISKHILNIESFTTPYEFIAADINRSGTITAFDMVQLRQLILNINTEFTNNTSWRFVDAAFNFGPLATTLSQNFPEIANINNIAADQLAVDFIAVKIGDINGSALASSLVSAESRNANGTLVFTAEDRSVAKGEQVSVSFTAAGIASVEGYQFTMNHAGLELTQIVEGVAKAANFNNVRGALATSWNGKATATDVLFTTEFTATADGLLSELISVSSDVTAAEAYNTAGELLEVAIEFTTTPAASFELMQNTPNPFNAETVIGFNLPTAGEATLKVMDIQGKVLKAITADYTKGYNQISLNAKELGATGVLQYQLESADNVVTKKMIIID